ncbi:MAG: hypothetical protein ACKVP2_15160 [Burkholderiales bacterium]
MKFDRHAAVISLLLAIIILLVWALVFYARDEFNLGVAHEEEEVEAKSALETRDGQVAVKLSARSRQASGIETATLTAAQSRGRIEVYGLVVDPRPLFDLRARYLAALGEARSQNVVVAHAQDDFQRLERLFAEDRNVAERVVLAAQNKLRGDQARLAALELAAESLRTDLRVDWGDKFATLASDRGAKIFDSLADRKEVLVRVVMLANGPRDLSAARLHVGPAGTPGVPGAARYLAPAPQADPGSPGGTHFYIVEAGSLRQGMRLAGHLEQSVDAREGVLIPDAAVVWHGGKAWCYVQEEDGEYVRREVIATEELPGGWFQADGYKVGDEVVIRGTQLLLSEEQKFQIREENDD